MGAAISVLNPKESKNISQRVEAVIESVDAASFADHSIGEMSGGQQQRLLIAQALVTNPRMLVLDEPLESLDLANQQAIANIIRRIAKEMGAAVYWWPMTLIHHVIDRPSGIYCQGPCGSRHAGRGYFFGDAVKIIRL